MARRHGAGKGALAALDSARARSIVAVAAVALFFACQVACSERTRESAPAPSAHAGASSEPGPRYGELMAEVGRRFELLGRAVRARRFELAAFELDELKEIFTDDLPHASPPRVPSSVDLPGMARAWLDTHPKQIEAVLRARDQQAFASAFAHAAASCNACHQASLHAFIEVPTEPGEGVPRLTLLPETPPSVDQGAHSR